MKTIYHLSNAQKKALLIRAQTLQILLPVPPVEVEDWPDWARSVLPADLRPLVRSAIDQEIRVAPSPRLVGPPATLTDLLGVVPGPTAPPGWTVAMAVVRVTLATDHPRGNPLPPQWPTNVLIDGVPLLGAVAVQ